MSNNGHSGNELQWKQREIVMLGDIWSLNNNDGDAKDDAK